MYTLTLPSFERAAPGDNAHRDAFISEVKTGLANAVAVGDASAGVERRLTITNRFLTLRYVPSEEDRVFLVKTLVELVSIPNIDFHLAHSFASTAVRLAKKDKLLTPDLLEIDWKPLWALSSFPRGGERVFNVDSTYAQEVLKLVRTVRRLFPVTATTEILQEFMPDINPHNTTHFLNIVGHMTVFLPTNRVPTPSQSLVQPFPGFPQCSLSGLLHRGRTIWTNQSSACWRGWLKTKLEIQSCQLIPYFARFIINTIYPSQKFIIDGYAPPTISITLLQTLLQAAETYFHPSNYGPWSLKLASLLHHLSVGFLKRWRKELEPDCKTPTNLRLTPELKESFDPRAVNEANGSIKSLAYLDPGTVLPKVLERVFPALETLTEGVTILPILNRELFPAGAKNFVDILNLTLPGIDMNDPMKTTNNESEDDRDVRFSTAGFEGWFLLFLNRIYVMFENLPQIHGSSEENTMENVLLSMATYSLQIIFQQTSPEINELALKSLAKFVATTVIPSATKAVGKILSVAGGSYPSRKLHHILPLTASRIREELASNASSKPSLPQTAFPFSFASLSDAALHWHQVIEEMILGCKSYRGVKWAAKTIQVAVYNLTAVYPKEFRSFEAARWEDPAFFVSSYKRAGNFTVDWHTPSEPELVFAVNLLSKYADLTFKTLESLIQLSQNTPATSSDASRDQSFEFTRWILILKSLIMSIGGLIAPWDDDLTSPLSSTPLFDFACPINRSKVTPSCGYLPLSSPHHTIISQLRHKIGNLLNETMVHFEKHREDDVAPLRQLIKATTAFVTFRGVKASTLAKQINGFKYIKELCSVENGKRLPRYLLVKRSQKAQSALNQTLVPFEALKKRFYKMYLLKLVSPDAPEHVVKGCLHPSIQELVRNIFVGYLENMSQLSIGFSAGTDLVESVKRIVILDEGVFRVEFKARAMAINLLEIAWRPQDAQPVALTNILLDGIVSAHPTFRDVSIALILLEPIGPSPGKRSDGDAVDTKAYLRESVVAGTMNIHDTSIVGWYCWPKNSKFHTLAGSEFNATAGSGIESLPFFDLESRETLEQSSKGAETFNSELFNLVWLLAGQFQDSFVSHVKRIVLDLLKDSKEKSKQRVAAEFLGGLVRGSNNWSTVKSAALWEWVTPIVTSAFQSSTAETVRFWIDFLNAVLVNRDPRRVLPLIHFVFNWKLDPSAQSFFTESKKLTFLKIVVSNFKWRLLPLYPALLAELLSQVRHPYQQVRDVLGVLIDEVMQLLWHPSANSSGDFKAVVPVMPHESVNGLVEKLFEDMQVWRGVERVNNIGPSDYGNASKTVIAWLLASMARNPTTSKFTCFHLQIPELFRMIDYNDSDLQQTASGIATVYSHTSLPLHFLPRVIDQILGLLDDSNLKWQAKLKLIPSLQILFFKNLVYLSSETKLLILETVSGLLGHSQVEVRNLAGVTLSGLVRCSERASISTLKTMFETALKATKAAKRRLRCHRDLRVDRQHRQRLVEVYTP
ncbi:UNVERIFIED_CONTAM: hypothetical protein HDU68_006845 [Siphonaria sp. JEL0065]|nr:hypothetical protein HDU68_006845 [Siphonaria sp. JEL0065]